MSTVSPGVAASTPSWTVATSGVVQAPVPSVLSLTTTSAFAVAAKARAAMRLTGSATQFRRLRGASAAELIPDLTLCRRLLKPTCNPEASTKRTHPASGITTDSGRAPSCIEFGRGNYQWKLRRRGGAELPIVGGMDGTGAKERPWGANWRPERSGREREVESLAVAFLFAAGG